MSEPVHARIGTVAYRCTVEWRNGSFVTDEPGNLGGSDAGPDPFTLLLSSLATCTLVTLRAHIDKHGWDVPSIAVSTNYVQTLRKGSVSTTIDRDVVFSSPVTSEQEEVLRAAAAKCPVSRLLEGEVTVRTFVRRETATDEREYANDQIAVLWRAERCQHSQRCWRQLPKVFDPQARPWITPDGASPEQIIRQVQACPSGALGYRIPNQAPADPTDNEQPLRECR